MGNLAQYFDYERFARDLFMFDYLFAAATCSAVTKPPNPTQGSLERAALVIALPTCKPRWKYHQ